MKRPGFVLLMFAIALAAIVLSVHAQHPARRIGMVIGIKPDKIQTYEALHAATNPGVRDLLAKYHMHDFSIFIHQLDDGRYYLFGYYEYTGDNYEADMKRLAAEPRNIQWLQMTDPLQAPLKGQRSWSMMQEVYHNH